MAITIADTQGKLVRQLDGTGFEGLNRVAWDLHYPAQGPSTAERKWAIAGGFFYRAADGPIVEPGVYTVKVSQGANQATKTVTVSDDPDVSMSASDRAARHTAVMRAYELYKSGIEGANRLRAMRTIMESTLKTWKAEGAPPIPEAIRKNAEALSQKIDEVSPLFIGNPDPMNTPLTYRVPPLPERTLTCCLSWRIIRRRRGRATRNS